ncbi:glycosyltransferase, partial [Yoonia sp.]|nr:glycosyltransferase [Yoonia sp.]
RARQLHQRTKSIDQRHSRSDQVRAKIVLNDHTKVMKDRGLLSNRVFDALACGAVPVSEDVGFIPDDIAEFVYTFKDEESFKAAMQAAKSETASKRERRTVLAKELARTHSFHARARTILDVVAGIKLEIGTVAE